MNSIDKKIVKHVAFLARLSLSEAELDLYSKQLSSILLYISKLNEVDTANTAPTSHAASNLKNVFRKDAVRVSLAIDDALNNAPSREGDLFKVPQIIEGK